MDTQITPDQRRPKRRRVAVIVTASLVIAASASAALGAASHASRALTERQCAAARATDRAVARAAEKQLAKVEPIFQRMVDTVDPDTGARYLNHPGGEGRPSGYEYVKAISHAQVATMSFDHDQCASAYDARNITHWAAERRSSTADLRIALRGAQRDLDLFRDANQDQEAAR